VLLGRLDAALKGLVGAAAGVARVELERRQLVYAGLGNVGARVFGREEVRLVSAHGILGQRFRRPVEQRVELEERDVFLMHSDGISERFDRDVFPELGWAPAAKIAALLLSRYGKQHDDASCLVARMIP
jgi:serine/threonine protein phosphatase PrpC